MTSDVVLRDNMPHYRWTGSTANRGREAASEVACGPEIHMSEPVNSDGGQGADRQPDVEASGRLEFDASRGSGASRDEERPARSSAFARVVDPVTARIRALMRLPGQRVEAFGVIMSASQAGIDPTADWTSAVEEDELEQPFRAVIDLSSEEAYDVVTTALAEYAERVRAGDEIPPGHEETLLERADRASRAAVAERILDDIDAQLGGLRIVEESAPAAL